MASGGSEYPGNTVKFSPVSDSLLAVTTAYVRSVGGGCLNIYGSMPYTISSLRAQFFNFFDCSWSLTNSNLIIIATNWGRSHLIDIRPIDNQLRESFLRHNHTITTSVDWHLNGSSFLSASTDGIVNLWSISQPNSQYTYSHPRDVSCVTWNPQIPNVYASTCFDGNLRIWDIRNGNAVITIQADDAPLATCDWNCHGETRIATASHHRNYISVWDITQPNIPVKVLHGAHTDGVRRVKFSPHREYQIASSSYDHRVVLWDYGLEDTNPRITRYKNHTAKVLGLDMSKRVKGRLASCGADGIVHLWQHELPEA